MKRVAHVVWESQGGMRRHVRTLALHPPTGYETAFVAAPASLREYFGDIPFRPVGVAGILRVGRDVDVVHAHGVTAALAALAPGGRPTVVSLHVVVGGSGRTASSRVVKSAAKLIAARADALIAVSDRTAAGFPRARVIPPAFDPLPPPSRTRAEVRGALGAAEADTIVITVSRLEPGKRLEWFVRAVAAAGCTGWIVGDGSGRPAIERAASSSNVRLLGYRTDVSDLLRAADLFALPSVSESYGIAVAEAIDAGLPVVATRTGDIERLVGGAGVIVDVGDEEGFVRAVCALAGDSSERGRLVAAARQETRPDRDELIARVGEVYDELVR